MRSVFIILFFFLLAGSLFAVTDSDSDIKDIHELQYSSEGIVSNQQSIEAVQIIISGIDEKVTAYESLLNEQQNQIYDLSEYAENIEKTFHENLFQLSESLSALTSDFNVFKNHIEGSLETLATSINKIEQQVAQNHLLTTEMIDELRHSLAASRKELNQRIENVDLSASQNEAQLEFLGHDVDVKAKYFSYLIFLAGFIGAVGVVLGILIHRKHANSKNLLDENISNVHRRVEEEYVTLDTKIADLLQNQMNLSGVVSTTLTKVSSPSIHEPDHSLPLRVGEEIFRMRQRLNSLPHDTKGLKPLLKSLERMEDEFTEKGYEVVDMTNQPFSDGLNVKARFIPSEDLGPGEHIILK